MGGNLFKTRRLPLLGYLACKREISSVMDFYGIEYKIPRHYYKKKDFGDLDVIIKNTTSTNELLKIFNGYECYYDKRETIVSFNIKNFQIDFIRVDPMDFETAFYYFSFNDLGNLIGQLAKIKSLKFGVDGLKYNHYIKGQLKGVIHISNNFNKILKFLDLDPTTYHKGFSTLEEMFDFIIDSRYFNPYVSDLKPYGFNDKGIALYRLNKDNREKNSKRMTFISWLNYIQKYKTGEDDYIFRDDNIDKLANEIDKFFPEANFKTMLKSISDAENYRLELRKKFNGNIIKILIPELKDVDFQFFIDSFESYIEEGFKSFKDYIIITDQDEIEKSILNFYKYFKERYYE